MCGALLGLNSYKHGHFNRYVIAYKLIKRIWPSHALFKIYWRRCVSFLRYSQWGHVVLPRRNSDCAMWVWCDLCGRKPGLSRLAIRSVWPSTDRVHEVQAGGSSWHERHCPEAIYNMDEIGVTTVQRPSKDVAEKGIKRIRHESVQLPTYS